MVYAAFCTLQSAIAHGFMSGHHIVLTTSLAKLPPIPLHGHQYQVYTDHQSPSSSSSSSSADALHDDISTNTSVIISTKQHKQENRRFFMYHTAAHQGRTLEPSTQRATIPVDHFWRQCTRQFRWGGVCYFFCFSSLYIGSVVQHPYL